MAATRSADDLAASQAEAKRWLGEVERQDKRANVFVTKGRKIVARYRDERKDSAEGVTRQRRRFNVLWSNIQTLMPALYGKRPEPVVERRYLDHDPVGRVASTILERCTKYEIEDNGYNEALSAAVLDYLLVGRGQVWVRYEPKFGETLSPEQDGGSPYDSADGNMLGGGAGDQTSPETTGQYAGSVDPNENGGFGGDEASPAPLISEKIPVDYVYWEDFLTSQARVWSEVTWVGRRLYLSRSQGVARFGDIFKQVPLQKPRDGAGRYTTTMDGDDSIKAEVYEIWCLEDKKVHFVAKGFSECLETVDDPLKLESFWPCPSPLRSTITHDTIEPVADYIEYQDQAEELDQLTNRIASLMRSLKVSGAYDASAEGLQRILDESNENKLVPVNNWAMFAEKGGIDGAISWLPIKDVAAVLAQLFESRSQIKQDLYEITGISDIIRGQTDPNETLGAQQMKANNFSGRLGARQQEVARFARDVIRIIAEIVAEQWSPETMVMASAILQDDGLVDTPTGPQANPLPPQPMMGHNGGPPMPPNPGLAPQSALPGSSAVPVAGPGPTPPPGMAPPMPMMPPPDPMAAKMQMIAQAIGLLREQKMRGFRVEIETDSTIQADALTEKNQRVEFVTAITGMIQQVVAAAPVFPAIIPLAGKALTWVARGFRVGRDLEAALDTFVDAAEQFAAHPPADPNAGKAQADQQKAAADLQIQQQKFNADMVTQQAEMERQKMQIEADQQSQQLDLAIKQMDLQSKSAQSQRDEEFAQAEHVRRMVELTVGAVVDHQQAKTDMAAAKAKPNGASQ